jgi:hypothetical protein
MEPPAQLRQRATWQPRWNQTALTAKPVAFRSCPQATPPHRQQVCQVPLGLVLALLLAHACPPRQNGYKCHAKPCCPCPCNRCRLTLPSRGCPKGCAFQSPLMSNVRRREESAVQLRANVAAARHRVQYTTLRRLRRPEAGVRHLEGHAAPNCLAK